MTSDSNKALVQRYFEMWNTGDTAIADEVLALDYVDQAHPEIVDIAGIKDSVLKVRAAFPGFQISIDFMLAEGDKVALRNILRRTQQGQEVLSNGLVIFRVADGRLAEQWSAYEPAS